MRVTHLQLFEWGTAAQVRNPESDRCGFQRLFVTRGAQSHTNMSKAKSKSDNKTEKALAAEKEQFNKQQVNKILV